MNGLPRKLGCATPSRVRNARLSFELFADSRGAISAPLRLTSSGETTSSPRGRTRLRVLSHFGRDDAVGIDDRLATLDLIHVSHAFGDLAPDRVLAVEKRRIREADEELTIAGIRRLRPRHRD